MVQFAVKIKSCQSSISSSLSNDHSTPSLKFKDNYFDTHALLFQQRIKLLHGDLNLEALTFSIPFRLPTLSTDSSTKISKKPILSPWKLQEILQINVGLAKDIIVEAPSSVLGALVTRGHLPSIFSERSSNQLFIKMEMTSYGSVEMQMKCS